VVSGDVSRASSGGATVSGQFSVGHLKSSPGFVDHLSVRGLPLVLLAFLLAGCAFGGGDRAPEATDNDGFTRYEISAGNFSIEIPDTWHATTSMQMKMASFKVLARDNPVFRPYAEAATRKNSPFKFVAYDPVMRKRFATNLNVVVAPVSAKTTPGALRRDAVAEAKSRAASKVVATDVTLAAGEAVRLEYRSRFPGPRKQKLVSTLQYALLVDKKVYVLTYTTLPDFAAEYEWAFRRSANSFRLVES
jgi:hypothetical protein